MKMIQFIKKMGLMMAAFGIVLGASSPVRAGNEITQAESYFTGLKTVKSRFVQTSADGSQTRGTFYLNRPGKLRFEYDPPSKDFVVADGLFIYFYDGEMKQHAAVCRNRLAHGVTSFFFSLRKPSSTIMAAPMKMKLSARLNAGQWARCQ